MNHINNTSSQKVLPSPGRVFEEMVHDTLDPYFLNGELDFPIQKMGKEGFFHMAQIIYAVKNNLIQNFPTLIDTHNPRIMGGQKIVQHPFNNADLEQQRLMIGMFAKEVALTPDNFPKINIEEIFREKNIQMRDIITGIEWTEKNEIPFSLDPVVKNGTLNLPYLHEIPNQEKTITHSARTDYTRYNPLTSGKRPQKKEKYRNASKIPQKKERPLPDFQKEGILQLLQKKFSEYSEYWKLKIELGIANRKNPVSAKALSVILYALSQGASFPKNIKNDTRPIETYLAIKNPDNHIEASIAYEQEVLQEMFDAKINFFPLEIFNFRLKHALAQGEKNRKKRKKQKESA